MTFKCQLTLDVFQTELRPNSFKSHPNLTGLNSLNVPGKALKIESGALKMFLQYNLKSR